MMAINTEFKKLQPKTLLLIPLAILGALLLSPINIIKDTIEILEAWNR